MVKGLGSDKSAVLCFDQGLSTLSRIEDRMKQMKGDSDAESTETLEELIRVDMSSYIRMLDDTTKYEIGSTISFVVLPSYRHVLRSNSRERTVCQIKKI